MDANGQRLKTLGEFIKSRRKRLTPELVGLPPGYASRRTPGLRREEVSLMAGVSLTWYTWLEQGRDIRVSKQVLDSIARALRFDDDEYAHLLELAQLPTSDANCLPEAVGTGLRLTIDALPYPTLAVNDNLDVLVWNQAACDTLADFEAMAESDRNLLWQWFCGDVLPSRIADWEVYSPYVAGVFRGARDRNPDDPRFDPLVRRLEAASPSFAAIWSAHDVRRKSANRIALLNDAGEREAYEVTALMKVNGREDVHLFVFTLIH